MNARVTCYCHKEDLLFLAAPRYEIDPSSERLCIIINNKTFEGERYRHGSDQDVAGLRKLFKRHLAFTVDYHEDKTVKEIRNLMKHLKNKGNISHCSCVFVIILSHGCDEEIEGSDNKRIALKAITKYLNDKNCPPLKGKPKVFIVQACRGSTVDDIASDSELSSDTNHLHTKTDGSYSGEISLNGVDMLIAYATIPDHVAYRNSTTGSLYIQKFIEVMYERAHDTHLEDILKQVSRDLSQTDPQMPSYTVQLRKDLYLPVDPR